MPVLRVKLHGCPTNYWLMLPATAFPGEKWEILCYNSASQPCCLRCRSAPPPPIGVSYCAEELHLGQLAPTTTAWMCWLRFYPREGVLNPCAVYGVAQCHHNTLRSAWEMCVRTQKRVAGHLEYVPIFHNFCTVCLYYMERLILFVSWEARTVSNFDHTWVVWCYRARQRNWRSCCEAS
jgi:hypothetical protein